MGRRPFLDRQRDMPQGPAGPVRRGPRWMLGGIVAGLGAFLAIVVDQLADGPLEALDAAVDDHVARSQAEGFPASAIGEWLSLIGDWRTGVAVIALSVAWMLWARQRVLAVWTVLVAVLASAANRLLKEVFERPRPPLDLLDSYSFPSGHTFAAAAVLGVAIVLSTETLIRVRHERAVDTGHDWAVALPLWGTLAVLTAAGRVLTRAHWVSDTLASMALGLALVCGVLYVLSRRSRGGDPGPTVPPKPGRDT